VLGFAGGGVDGALEVQLVEGSLPLKGAELAKGDAQRTGVQDPVVSVPAVQPGVGHLHRPAPASRTFGRVARHAQGPSALARPRFGVR